ncbi:hypothetical protein [Demequina zhanjiangensis]|uniref:FtsX-like permease family protein n=1 Tax=Demequina zhanjiangensis TaxID=3051659 RepID=A0ABT8FZ89_9MICO|nr:hypothetical protein [Demequina sp. SYSU T00b26]MDN4472210.1 hypothetical protein [Demequina sp. SYSU T00b26]
MRAAAATVMGIAVAAVMAISIPWGLGTYGETFYYSSDSMGFAPLGFLVIYLAIPAALLTAVLTAMLGVRAKDAHERAVMAALGETAGTSIRRAVLVGLRDGAIAAGIAYAFMGAMHLAVESANGWPSFTTETNAWATRAVEGAVGIVALTVAHLISAWRRNRSPVELSRAAVGAYRRPKTGHLAVRAGVVLAAAAGLIVGLALTHDGDAGGSASGLADGAYMTVWIAAVAVALTALLPAATALAFRGVGLASRVADRLGSTQLAAVLRTRSADRTKAAARVVLVIGVFGFAAGALGAVDTGVRHSDSFAFIYTENPTDPVETVARIEAMDGVTDVVAADVVGLGADDWTEVVAVDPADLVGVDDELADALLAHPGAAVASSSLAGGDASRDGGVARAFRPDAVVPLVGWGLAYVDATEVDLDSTGHTYLVYVSEGADRMAIGDQLMDAVLTSDGASPASQGITFPAGQDGGYSWETPDLGASLFWIVVVVLALAPVAFTAVRAGTRDAATLTALGSPARAVRTAVAIEGAVLGLTAATIGVVSGVATGALTEVLDRARLSLDGVITDSYLAVALDSINWVTSLGFIVVVSLAYAALAAMVASAVHLETPAEALKEGTATR